MTTVENRVHGAVKCVTLRKYFNAMGSPACFPMLLLVFVIGSVGRWCSYHHNEYPPYDPRSLPHLRSLTIIPQTFRVATDVWMTVWLNDSFNAGCGTNATNVTMVEISTSDVTMYDLTFSNATAINATILNAMGDNIAFWEGCGVFKEEYYVFVFIGLSILTSCMYLVQVGEDNARMGIDEGVCMYVCVRMS